MSSAEGELEPSVLAFRLGNGRSREKRSLQVSCLLASISRKFEIGHFGEQSIFVERTVFQARSGTARVATTLSTSELTAHERSRR